MELDCRKAHERVLHIIQTKYSRLDEAVQQDDVTPIGSDPVGPFEVFPDHVAQLQGLSVVDRRLAFLDGSLHDEGNALRNAGFFGEGLKIQVL